MRAGGLALVLCLAALAGCGEEQGTDYAPVDETELAISVDADGPGGEPAQEAEIACPAANAPQQACRAIEELPEDAAAPTPPDTPCTEIYGGPDVVTIEGTLDGEPIETELTRANGCEIERFDRFGTLLAALFPDYEPGL